MGWFQAKRYAPAISKVAFGLQPGQTSPIFQGPDGWYIIKVEQKMPAGQDSLDKVHDRIEARMRQEQLIPARDAWLKAERKQARIAVKDRDLAAQVKLLLATAPPEPVLPGLMTPDRMMTQAQSNTAALGLGGG
jgi:parvulin-like peptidyl-prolyl isomerase